MENLFPAPARLQKVSVAIITGLLFTLSVSAQTNRQVNHQSQTWFSVNTIGHFNNQWSIIADAHIRRNRFLAQSGFEFVRTGIQYHVGKNLYLAIGYAHMWQHPSAAGWKTISQENRIYQQAILLSKFHTINIMQRFRNEQRWQQKISGDKFTGDYRFTDRFRYLLGLTIPVFKNNNFPALSISDEILIQAGKEVIYNTFDQNRFFAGIRQKVTKNLSFDAGYLIIYQQKYSRNQYDFNNIFRLFFYYTPSLSKKN